MTPEQLSVLAQKYLSGRATKEEQAQLNEWYYDHPMDKEWVAEIPAVEGEDAGALEQKMVTRLFHYLELDPEKTTEALQSMERARRYRRLLPAYGVAAALMLACMITGLIYYHWHAGKELAAYPSAWPDNKINPGSNKAVLTLADGSTLTLDSTRSGQLAQQGNVSVQQSSKGMVAYHPAGGNANGEMLYNILSVPRGGQYRLELPDGSKVWLDAASSIRYPVAFGNKERTVEMSGEAYFDITPDPSRPFKVKVSDREEVEVLGTQFNVNAYENETALYTTLLQGRIRVVTPGNKTGWSPAIGQQVILDKSGKGQLNEKADEESVVAWKNGMFVFNNEHIGTIMRQIERWYDIKVRYDGDVQDKSFTGQISRYEQVTQVLKMLELTQEIHFKMEKGNIIVSP